MAVKPFAKAIKRTARYRDDRASLPRGLMDFYKSIKVGIRIRDRGKVSVEIKGIASRDRLIVGL